MNILFYTSYNVLAFLETVVNDLQCLKQISSLGKRTACSLRFIAGSASDVLREGLPLERDVLSASFPAKFKLFAIRL